MSFVLSFFLFSLLYDPVFLKDYSIETLWSRSNAIKGFEMTNINTFEDTTGEKPFISLTPNLKVFNVNANKLNYTNSYLNLEFDLGARVDSFQFFAKVNFFNFVTPYRLSYHEPLSDYQYNLYSFDVQPVIGGTFLFDINVQKAYIKYSYNNFNMMMGRNNIAIGEGLLFSGLSYPLDHIYRVSFKIKNLSFLSAFATTLDTFLLKTISYQVLEWSPVNNVVFTVYEAVSHTGPDVFKYFNPLSLYYERQRRGVDNNDNLLGGVVAKVRIKERFSVFFDFLNDDFILFKGGTSKYGVLVGTEWITYDNSFFRLTAVAIPRFTYTHGYSADTNSWKLMGLPIGYPRGNDLIDVYFTYVHNFGLKRNAIVRVALLNKGEGTLDEHWEGSGLPKNMPFPTGDVDRRFFTLIGYKCKSLYAGGFFDYNYSHQKSAFGVFLYFSKKVFEVQF